MSGLSDPTDPDNKPASTDAPAARPMTPDADRPDRTAGKTPEHDSVSPAFEDEPASDEVASGGDRA